MDKRLCSLALALILLLGCFSASASSVMTTAEKEALYRKTVDELQSYLEDLREDTARLSGIRENFQSLGGYQKNRAMYFSYYTGVLLKVAGDTYDREFNTWLEVLGSNQDFQDYLKEIGTFGSVDSLKAYAEGRRLEAAGADGDAMKQYRQCLEFFDATPRYNALLSDQDRDAYESAVAMLNAGNYAGAYYAFSEIQGYQDSGIYMDSIVRQLGYTPANAADNPKPVTGLKVTRTMTNSVALAWEANTHRATYRVECRQAGSSVKTLTTSHTDITISGLKAGTQYTFSVTVISGQVETKAASVTAKTKPKTTPTPKPTNTPVPAPDPVSSLKTVSRTDTSVKLDWTSSYTDAVYAVYWRTAGSNDWGSPWYTRDTELQVNNLKAETEYEFRVVTIVNNVESRAMLLKNVRTEKKTGEKTVKAGDYITFGHYPQTASGTDNTPIEWLVLKVQGSKALVISRYGLDAKPYNTLNTDTTWEKCTLRTWLNMDFLNKAFSAAEQKAILTTKVSNSKGQGVSGWYTNGGNNTKDKLFLLSYAEANKYFSVTGIGDANTKSRIAPTAYAIRQGAFTHSAYKTADNTAAAGMWWLRSPGGTQYYAAYVSIDGSLRGDHVSYTNYCVRPAMWVDLDSGLF